MLHTRLVRQLRGNLSWGWGWTFHETQVGDHAAAGCADPAYGPGWGYPWDGPAGSLQEPWVGGPWVLDWWSDRRLGMGWTERGIGAVDNGGLTWW